MDIVTFARRPRAYQDQQEWGAFVAENIDIFSPKQVKAAHSCDAFYVDLFLPPEAIVSQTRYWFGLFSHQRSTSLWKGMVEVGLVDDDDAARELLEERRNAT
jgi:hypothetical protein